MTAGIQAVTFTQETVIPASWGFKEKVHNKDVDSKRPVRSHEHSELLLNIKIGTQW